MNLKKRTGIKGLPLAVLTAALLTHGGMAQAEEKAGGATGATEIVVYKDPNCGCCTKWSEHMRRAGFSVIENKMENMDAVKQRFGVAKALSSCHTAVVDGYIIEGHVPAEDVRRLLREKPDITGLTAPGMPQQSPGMQPEGEAPRNYDVLAFDRKGDVRVFSRY